MKKVLCILFITKGAVSRIRNRFASIIIAQSRTIEFFLNIALMYNSTKAEQVKVMHSIILLTHF